MIKHVLLFIACYTAVVKDPAKITPALLCNSCQAIVRETLKIVKKSKSEMQIDAAVEKICSMKKMNIYDFPPPQMVMGCEHFMTNFTDTVIEVMMNRESNDTVENSLCYEMTGICIEKGEEL